MTSFLRWATLAIVVVAGSACLCYKAFDLGESIGKAIATPNQNQSVPAPRFDS